MRHVIFRRAVAIVALGAFAAVAACGPAESTSGGTTDGTWTHVTPQWSSIYEGYFGPSGAASCTGGASCHSTLDTSGGVASNFTCASKDDCYASLTGLSHLVRSQDPSDPTSTPLLAKLRTTTGSGRMPSSSDFVFQPEDIDVLVAWISKGAKND
jgi:hypothetical protein